MKKNIDEIKKLKNLNKNTKIQKFLSFLTIILIVLLITLAFFLIRKYKFNFSKNNNLLITSRKELANEEKNYELQKYVDETENNLATIQSNVNNNVDTIVSLQKRIEDLESKFANLTNEQEKINLIKVSLNLQSDIKDNKNYSENLLILKNLIENSEKYKILSEKISYLDIYKDQNISNNLILSDFNSEMFNFIKKNNILKQNTNNITNFFSNFIIIRKVKNTELNTSDDFILKLENNINNGNYSKSLEIIKDNQQYLNYFQKTQNNLEIINNLNNYANDIINFIINNKD